MGALRRWAVASGDWSVDGPAAPCDLCADLQGRWDQARSALRSSRQLSMAEREEISRGLAAGESCQRSPFHPGTGRPGRPNIHSRRVEWRERAHEMRTVRPSTLGLLRRARKRSLDKKRLSVSAVRRRAGAPIPARASEPGQSVDHLTSRVSVHLGNSASSSVRQVSKGTGEQFGSATSRSNLTPVLEPVRHVGGDWARLEGGVCTTCRDTL